MDLSQYINREVIASLRNISLCRSVISDVMPISQNMRLSDIRECAIFGAEPFKCLMEAVIEVPNETYTILLGKEPIAMCGTREYSDEMGSASVWMLGTKGIDNNFMLFLRALKQCSIIELLQGHYKIIENLVPVDQDKTIQWLQWCGFKFEEIIENHYGYDLFRFNRCNSFEKSIYNNTSRPVMH
tara:strand:+ start:221 stop:775 length:555 start_codon:yes stop_codon:yes gene_type:complete